MKKIYTPFESGIIEYSIFSEFRSDCFSDSCRPSKRYLSNFLLICFKEIELNMTFQILRFRFNPFNLLPDTTIYPYPDFRISKNNRRNKFRFDTIFFIRMDSKRRLEMNLSISLDAVCDISNIELKTVDNNADFTRSFCVVLSSIFLGSNLFRIKVVEVINYDS